MTKQQIKLSKLLSKILRHSPEIAGLTMDKHGWVSVQDLIQGVRSMGKTISKRILEEIVATNNKQRFIFNETSTRIRATQGHSVPVDLEYDRADPPVVLYHGTSHKALTEIMRNGILSMNRNHVHLTESWDLAVATGSRHGKPAILVIDANEMVRRGYIFKCTPNEVWLTAEVPTRFIEVSFP